MSIKLLYTITYTFATIFVFIYRMICAISLWTSFARSAILGDTSWVRLTLQTGTCQIFSLAENPLVGPKKLWVQNDIWSKKLLNPSKFWVQKQFWVRNDFGPNMILGPKKFWSKNLLSLDQSWLNLTCPILTLTCPNLNCPNLTCPDFTLSQVDLSWLDLS